MVAAILRDIGARVTCAEFVAAIESYLARELTAETAAEADTHRRSCGACAGYLRRYEATIDAARSAFEDEELETELPDELAEAILSRRPKR